ncbi:MAG: hypothetical protein ABSB97_07810 [Thermoplasmata archaeon]
MPFDPDAGATFAFQVRLFRTSGGYLAWIDGLGTVEAPTLSAARREARRFVHSVVGGAFPDRPDIDPAGAVEVLRFRVDVRACRSHPRTPA